MYFSYSNMLLKNKMPSENWSHMNVQEKTVSRDSGWGTARAKPTHRRTRKYQLGPSMGTWRAIGEDTKAVEKQSSAFPSFIIHFLINKALSKERS